MPTPGVDLQTQGRKRFYLRIWRDAIFCSVSAKLATHNAVCIDRGDRLQDFHFLFPNGLAVCPDGRFHGKVGQDLKEMILDDVADGASLIVKGAAALDAELL